MAFWSETRVTELTGRGRGVVALSAMAAGAVILRELPLASTPLADKRRLVCNYCRRLGTDPAHQLTRSCSNCGHVFYCQNTNCAAADRARHRPLCPLHRALVKSDVLTPHQKTLAVLAAQCLLLLADRSQELILGQQPLAQVPTFEVHAEARDASGHVDWLIAQCHHGILRGWTERELSYLQCLLFDSLRLDTTQDVLRQLLLRFQMNAFYACDDLFKPHSGCVYVLASLINHACAPNCICVYDGVRLQVRTLQDVKPGEELTIAYVDLIRPRPERQHIIELDYSFACTCLACNQPTLGSLNEFKEIIASHLPALDSRALIIDNLLTNPTAFEAFRHIDRGLYTDVDGNLVIEPDLPGHWQGERNNALSTHVCAISAQLDKLRNSNSPALVLETWNACEVLRQKVHPCNRTLYALRSELFSQLLECGEEEIAINLAEDLMITLAFVYRQVPLHPQFALLLNTYLDLKVEFGGSVKKEWYDLVARSYTAVYGSAHAFTRAVEESRVKL